MSSILTILDVLSSQQVHRVQSKTFLLTLVLFAQTHWLSMTVPDGFIDFVQNPCTACMRCVSGITLNTALR